MRKNFVLHWRSVRPVPKLVIDFGDGRKMERTLTGNSIHYVLSPDGQVVDAIPGVYGPAAFLKQLTRGVSAASILIRTKPDDRRIEELRSYHRTRVAELEREWQNDVQRAGLQTPPSREIPKPTGLAPSAQAAAAASISKALVVERPMLRGLSHPWALESIGNDPGWSAIARLYQDETSLDMSTRRLMTRKDPALRGRVMAMAINGFQFAIAEDTVRDEYVYHAAIHRWLAGSGPMPTVDALNDRVYAELFLTPGWDQWLGLRPASSYSGIDNDGLLK
jgi:hypothetical protein